MPKKFGIVFVVIGAVLIASALLLFLYNELEDAQAGMQSEEVLSEVHAAIAARKEIKHNAAETLPDNNETAEPTAETEPEEKELPAVEVQGYSCIGVLSVPGIEIELPVLSDWDYVRLTVAPCRQFGSSRTDDLVIAAHNYSSHFGSLSKLELGAEIIFMDMDGIENRYELKRLVTLAPYAVDEVQYSGYDLVLYTCTPGGRTRVVAFCDRVAEATVNTENTIMQK